VVCFWDRVPEVSLRSTSGYALCSPREQSLRFATHSESLCGPSPREAQFYMREPGGKLPKGFSPTSRKARGTRRGARSDAEGIPESSRGLSEATPPEGRPPGGHPGRACQRPPGEPILCHPSAGWSVFGTVFRRCRCAPHPATLSVPPGNNASALPRTLRACAAPPHREAQF
jgi:hypothetical protein